MVDMFGVLGPLQAPDRLRLGRSSERREARILGALLLRANHPVPMTSLVDMLWPVAPPATARQQVQNCVSAIDRQLRLAGAPVLRRVAAGYTVAVDGQDLDALRFITEADAGRRYAGGRDLDRASAAFGRALAAWRGEVLAGIHLGPFEPIALHLSDLRLSTQEAWYDCELAAGRHRDVLPSLQRSVREHPLRERMVGQLMRALAAAGRTTEALDQFHQTRARLADDYGIEVGPELSGLFRGILRGETESTAVPAAPSVADELCQARELLRQATLHIERALGRVGEADRELTASPVGRP